MYEDLTAKEVEVLFFIKNFVELNGYPPTIREICKDLSIKSTSTVYLYLENIKDKGYIKRDPAKPRAIEIIDLENKNDILSRKKTIINVPVVAEIVSESSLLAVENIIDTYPLPAEDYIDKYPFMFEVKDDNYKKYGYIKGDMLIFDKALFKIDRKKSLVGLIRRI